MDPVKKLRTREFPRCEVQHDLLLVVDGPEQLVTIQPQGDCYRRVSHALVAVHKWMIGCEEESQRSGFVDDLGIQLIATERLEWLSDR
jgi:hypothetical protein